jgi:SsrA-binding protein
VEILNRKASFDYEIKETYEAGIALVGTEIKSIRKGNANLKESFIIIKNDEAFILNMHISHYEKGNVFNHEETRTRKLLLKKKEILKLKDAKNIDGQTIIPLKMYFKNNRAKLLIAIAKGKKLYDKREAIKKKETEREIKTAFKNLNK